MTSPSVRGPSTSHPTATAEGKVTPLPDTATDSARGLRPSRRPFIWNPADAADAGWVALMCGLAAKSMHGEVILESVTELAHREPRLMDAWRFFHAANLLARTAQTTIAAKARQLGARIALHKTGWTVVDMCHVEAGSSGALALYLRDREQPVVTYLLHGTPGETAIEQVAR